MLTAVGSSAYHWAPSNASLVGDRLPIAWACAALASAFLGERVATHWSRAHTLVAALALATLSVAFWWLTERAGQGDLRLYLFVQFLPMLLVPLGLGLGLEGDDADGHAGPGLVGGARLLRRGQAVRDGRTGRCSSRSAA